MTDFIRCAVVGNPIAHSRSPFIHHAFAQACGLALEYDRILAPVGNFPQTVQQFFAEGGRGLNITVPFKEIAYELAKGHLSARAQSAAAVNTLWIENGQLHGCNSDGPGLVTDLMRLGFTPQGLRILMLGAGGAARGCVLPLLEAGAARLKVVNRRPERAHKLASELAPFLPTTTRIETGALTDTEGEWDVVINATSSGLSDAAPATGPLHFAPQSLAYDMVYGAQATPFMQSAQQAGASTQADGLGMLVGQAAISFEIWHGLRPDTAPVLAQLRTELQANV
ncbi:MAG TPA: shikimate dehydrogenase [Candidatus Paenalcaligenes intestinipullorum]|uniref:Shikimate dehydrogenase (NADP(+)) n=1 Tax=Candidatus Paenalcaligenes intestinipullorum TaxID=2838718 RepID=A0A9D2U8Q7_9BURK|nr:shikimate dehydrogenase [Candidatus Paenalcaligenes intestinipullorum]